MRNLFSLIALLVVMFSCKRDELPTDGVEVPKGGEIELSEAFKLYDVLGREVSVASLDYRNDNSTISFKAKFPGFTYYKLIIEGQSSGYKYIIEDTSNVLDFTWNGKIPNTMQLDSDEEFWVHLEAPFNNFISDTIKSIYLFNTPQKTEFPYIFPLDISATNYLVWAVNGQPNQRYILDNQIDVIPSLWVSSERADTTRDTVYVSSCYFENTIQKGKYGGSHTNISYKRNQEFTKLNTGNDIPISILYRIDGTKNNITGFNPIATSQDVYVNFYVYGNSTNKDKVRIAFQWFEDDGCFTNEVGNEINGWTSQFNYPVINVDWFGWKLVSINLTKDFQNVSKTFLNQSALNSDNDACNNVAVSITPNTVFEFDKFDFFRINFQFQNQAVSGYKCVDLNIDNIVFTIGKPLNQVLDELE